MSVYFASPLVVASASATYAPTATSASATNAPTATSASASYAPTATSASATNAPTATGASATNAATATSASATNAPTATGVWLHGESGESFVSDFGGDAVVDPGNGEDPGADGVNACRGKASGAMFALHSHLHYVIRV